MWRLDNLGMGSLGMQSEFYSLHFKGTPGILCPQGAAENCWKINELYTQGISMVLLTTIDDLPHNLKVVGSNPTPATNINPRKYSSFRGFLIPPTE